MESIKELKVICQTTAQKDISNVYMRYICRPISLRITRLLIPTEATPDQVSFAMIITGIISSLVFLIAHPISFLLGALLLQLWYILDCVDGELARYRSYSTNKEVIQDKASLAMTGAYWDYLNHYIVHGLVPLTIAYGLFLKTQNPSWMLVGFAASIFQVLLLAIHDTKCRAYLCKIRKAVPTHVLNIKPPLNKTEAAAEKKKFNLMMFFKLPFVAVHYLATYPSVMNVAALLALLSCLTGFRSDFRGWFLWFYALGSGIVFLGLAYQLLHDKGLDKDFDKEFYFETRT